MIEIDYIANNDWLKISADAYRRVFKEERPSAGFDKIDYALMARNGGELVGYVTSRILDDETVYWQFGGAFYDVDSKIKIARSYEAFIEWTRNSGIKRVRTCIENGNIRYIKMAMHFGFRIVGTRTVNGDILLELVNEFN